MHSLLTQYVTSCQEGVYMKKHLLGGVAKGAFTEAEAEAKFEAWKNNKQSGLAALKAKEDEAKKAEAKLVWKLKRR